MDWTRFINILGCWIFCFIISPITWAAIPCDADLQQVGFSFYSKYMQRKNLQPASQEVLDKDKYGHPHLVVRTFLAGDILFRAVVLGNRIIVYSHPSEWLRDPQSLGRVHRVIPLPQTYVIHDNEVSEIGHLVNHPEKPYALAVGTGEKAILINLVSGEIFQRFPSPGLVTSIILDADKLMVGTHNEVLLFRPQDQRGLLTSKQALAKFEIIGHATHLTETEYSKSQAVEAFLAVAARNRTYLFGYNHNNQTYRRPILSFPNSVVFLHLFTQPTSNPHESGRSLLLVRTANPTLSTIHVIDVNSILESNGKNIQSHAQVTPPHRHFPHTALFSYRQEVTGGSSPTESIGVLIANSDFTRGFIYDITDDHTLQPISARQVAQLLRISSPFDMPLD